jgi:hypothetical protein
MSQEDEVREILCDLVRIGLLRIRVLSGEGYSKECFIEADHLHNLPALIKSLQPELLSNYWNIERPAFMQQAPNVEEFQAHWEKLAEFLEK